MRNWKKRGEGEEEGGFLRIFEVFFFLRDFESFCFFSRSIVGGIFYRVLDCDLLHKSEQGRVRRGELLGTSSYVQE